MAWPNNTRLPHVEKTTGEFSLQLRVWAGVVTAIITTTVLGFLSWRDTQKAAQEADWVAHTQEVLTTLEITVKHMDNVETSGRGFALSGYQPFLQSFQEGKTVLEQNLRELDPLVSDNPVQLQRLALLKQQVNAKVQASDWMVNARQQKGAAPDLNQLEQGRRLIDAVHNTVLQMENEEKQLLAAHADATQVARHSSNTVMALGSFLGVFFLAVAGFATLRQLATNARTRVRLESLNADLERRVEQRTMALKESEERLAGIIRSAMDSIITVDETQRVVLFNDAAEKMFRCPAAQAIGQPISNFIPERFREAHVDYVRKFGETGVTSRSMGAMRALCALRNGGEEFPIEASISQVETAGKKMFTVILRDITERKHTEEQRERLAAIVASSDDAIISKTLEGIITAWNSGAEKLFGYTAAEAIGKPIQILFPPECANDELDILERLRRGIRIEHFETVRVRKDGRKINISATISPIRDAQGTIIGASKIARDITERKRTEAALAEQAEELSHQAQELLRSQHALQIQTALFQSVLDSMSEGLVTADETGKLVIWNPAAQKILGLGPTHLSSRHWSEHYGIFQTDTITPFPPDRLPLVRAIRGENNTAQMFCRNSEIPDGAWVEASASPLKDKDGKLIGGVVAFRDISQKRADDQEIRRLNEELELRVIQRTAELEEANKELEAFTYSVSHDLRAPLRHIAGFSGILLEEYGPSLDAQAQKYLRRIQDGTVRMGCLVDELLTLARVGRQSPNLQLAGLDSIVQEVVSMLEPETEGRQINWKIAKLPFADCDPTLMKQVFQNLLSNALKYSRPRAEAVIEIGQREANGQTVIFVRDNGVGFSMKYADKLFGVFQRLHRAEDFEGTGVGLATVHRIIKKHNGRIWAEAELDQGATFYFTLGGLATAPLQAAAALAGGQE